MPRALIINNHSIHLEQLRTLIPFSSDIVDWEHIVDIDQDRYDIIILSGGSDVPPIAEAPEAYTKERALIRASQLPIIGICLGCELIAYEFGATLKDLGLKRKEPTQIAFHADSPLSLTQDKIIAYEAHSRVIDSLPQSFVTIASSDHGPEIIHHTERPLWGIQFHPEHLTDRTLGDEVFLLILKQCLQTL